MSAGTVAVFPSFVTTASPLSFTSISASSNFKVGFAAFIASLTLPFSSAVNCAGFSTSTGLFGICRSSTVETNASFFTSTFFNSATYSFALFRSFESISFFISFKDSS